MQPLITQLPKVGTGKSRSPTSNILLKSVFCVLRSVDTRNYATENCVWQILISIHNIRELWGQNFYKHSTNLILFATFYVFETSFQKNVKSNVFLN